jgi:NAD(P)-dependent dehydrogenase (short-subunit alcohol dehydrogenase family)
MAGRLVLITGVGRSGQVGESVAKLFAGREHRVILVSRRADEVDARISALRDAGLDAAGYSCDLADLPQVAVLAERVSAEHGEALHALVNLAGGFATSGPVGASDPGGWEHMARINLLTAYHATRSFLPHLRRAHGAIVYFASASALPGASVADSWAYSAAKGAVLTLMRAVASEERQAGIRANAVAPTAIRTASNLETMGDQVRYVEREDVAEAVWYLCSDRSHAVTGQVVRLG